MTSEKFDRVVGALADRIQRDEAARRTDADKRRDYEANRAQRVQEIEQSWRDGLTHLREVIRIGNQKMQGGVEFDLGEEFRQNSVAIAKIKISGPRKYIDDSTVMRFVVREDGEIIASVKQGDDLKKMVTTDHRKLDKEWAFDSLGMLLEHAQS